jgi:hypothetical protein
MQDEGDISISWPDKGVYCIIDKKGRFKIYKAIINLDPIRITTLEWPPLDGKEHDPTKVAHKLYELMSE